MLSRPEKINQEYFCRIDGTYNTTIVMSNDKENFKMNKENIELVSKIEKEICEDLVKKGKGWFSVGEDVIRKCFSYSEKELTIMNIADISRYEKFSINVIPKMLKIESNSFKVLYECVDVKEIKEETKSMNLLSAIKKEDDSRKNDDEKEETVKREKMMYDRFEREKRDMRDKIQELRIKATLYKIEAEKLEEEYNETFG
jgi:hypothetical protein